jgi:hypothetical protein
MKPSIHIRYRNQNPLARRSLIHSHTLKGGVKRPQISETGETETNVQRVTYVRVVKNGGKWTSYFI